ncbi:hypothetical protein B296_00011665 [Ensete ventricosum]|uniref:Retrotransposon gag domain-containing protein n=1 Tax=Ensete ventricosum TaxID=4639 RepID=A0A426ZEK5_ENSVE|nr:hypothetical protein B296_00011665 [Ensete ventricosum]
MENRLQEIFNEFKRSLSENPNKSQHDESSSFKGKRSEKYDQGQDTGYPRKEFPKWEDEDPINWISSAKKFFRFHKTPKEFMVEIASTRLKVNAIQWYDLYETYHRVPLWGQFKRELLIHF